MAKDHYHEALIMRNTKRILNGLGWCVLALAVLPLTPVALLMWACALMESDAKPSASKEDNIRFRAGEAHAQMQSVKAC